MDATDTNDTINSLRGDNLLSVYEAIFNSISDAVIFVDTNRHILQINEAAINLFGYLPDEIRGKTTEIFYADKADYSDQGRKRYSADSAVNPEIYEINYKRKDGTTFVGEAAGSHVNDSKGAQLGFIGVIRDVTQRKQTDELAMRLGRIVEDSLNEIYLFDVDTLSFIEVNRGARENLGYSMDELRKITPYDIKPDFSSQQFIELIQPLRTGEQNFMSFETRHERKNGTTYPVEVHLQRVEFGATNIFLAIILDITERKQAEKELIRHRDHLEELVDERSAALKEQAQIIDQIHDSVVTTDLDGFVTSWNKGAERLFGYSIEEMLGKHISTVYPEEEHDFLQNEIINIVQEKGDHEVEVRMQNKNHDKFYAQLSLSILHDTSGAPKGMVGYSMDITARKNAEFLAQRHSNELAAANEELERFSYSVSHDLRSPLRAIDGFSQILIEDYTNKLDENGKDYLQRIRNGAQRMGQLIDDLLQLARINRTKLNKETVDLSAMAHEVIALLKENSPERDVEFKIDQNMHANADIGLLRIIVDNLLDNAWKYSSQQPTAIIKFGIHSSNGSTEFYVSDNGIGFDTQHAEHMFQPFHRLHGAQEFSGTGIGLATVQRIIQRHGGRIWAEAEPGKGATFFFNLD